MSKKATCENCIYCKDPARVGVVSAYANCSYKNKRSIEGFSIIYSCAWKRKKLP